MARSRIGLDYETYSDAQLTGPKSVGLWNYMTDMSTEALMVAYRIDDNNPVWVDLTEERLPPEFKDAVLDPEVEKWAFNAAFERTASLKLLGLDTPYKGWRCTQALANLQSFAGDLLMVGKAMGLDEAKLKDKEGSRLIQKFSVPQRITRKNNLWRRDKYTDPEDWELFGAYNIRDEVTEYEIRNKLIRFPIPEFEWMLYELDQQINDRGMPVNKAFVMEAQVMSERRKAELVYEMAEYTGLRNPNSSAQLMPWLKARGYWFDDLQKNTVKKVITHSEEDETCPLHPEAYDILKLRQQSSRTSVSKYPAMLRRLDSEGRLRHCFQFSGAARTARWAGRGPQPHNLTRTPKELEAEDGDASKLEVTAKLIQLKQYENLGLMFVEPMEALAGSVRSSFQAPEGYEFRVCDLSAIESAVIATVTKCKRLLKVFRTGMDPYKDFGTELYQIAYDEITKSQRTICKPAVLGCGYQLGGGNLFNGKRTGLWGYAENMGVNISEQEAARQVSLFRSVYHEIPAAWKALEAAFKAAIRGEVTSINGLVTFARLGPYVTITLPSKRNLYYYKPKIIEKKFIGRDGEPYVRKVCSYMGKRQMGNAWERVSTSGGKIIENIVQAIARDVLCVGMHRATEAGFKIVGHVHDEIVSLVRRGDNRLTLDLLRDCMREAIDWFPGLPLNAAGYCSKIYRKD